MVEDLGKKNRNQIPATRSGSTTIRLILLDWSPFAGNRMKRRDCS